MVLRVAEQALEAHRTAQRRECPDGHDQRFLANLWQMALRAGVEVALCLVEHSMSNSNPTELYERIAMLDSVASWQQ